MQEATKVLARIKKLAVIKGNIDTTEDYDRGLYNGLELALSVIMSREPRYDE